MIIAMDPEVRQKHEFVPQAIVKRSPAFFTDHGIRFGANVDDLNRYQLAELDLGGQPFALLHYDGTPPDETEIYLPKSVQINQLRVVIGDILTAFNLPHTALLWIREQTDTPF